MSGVPGRVRDGRERGGFALGPSGRDCRPSVLLAHVFRGSCLSHNYTIHTGLHEAWRPRDTALWVSSVCEKKRNGTRGFGRAQRDVCRDGASLSNERLIFIQQQILDQSSDNEYFKYHKIYPSSPLFARFRIPLCSFPEVICIFLEKIHFH